MRFKLLSSAALCLGLSSQLHAAPSVAVDIAPLHSLVSQVMQGVGTPSLIIPAEASPHSYSLRPSEAKALADADVVFWVGESLSPWLEKSLDTLAASAEKIEVLEIEGTITHAFREGATFASHDHDDHKEHGHDDEHDHHDDHKDHGHDEEHDHHDDHDDHKEHGHNDEHDHHDDHDDHKDHGHDEEHDHHGDHDDHKDHGHDEEHDHHGDHDDHKDHGHDDDHDHHDHEGSDPHAWLDPENAKIWVKAISEVLAQKDPANASTYASNAAKAVATLDTLIASTSQKIDALGQPQFIVFHDAYQYFEKRFGISAAGSIALGDAEDPSPARIKEIRDTVKKLGVNCVFTEPQYNPGIVKNVFEGTAVTTIGVMDPLGASINEGNTHYVQLIEGMVNSISQCQ